MIMLPSQAARGDELPSSASSAADAPAVVSRQDDGSQDEEGLPADAAADQQAEQSDEAASAASEGAGQNAKGSAVTDASDEEEVSFDSAKPRNVVAKAGDGQVTLTWDAVEGAMRYAIATPLGNGEFHTYAYDCSTSSYTVTGLVNGASTGFLVQAYIPAANGGMGGWSTFTVDDYVYATPHGATQPVPTATATGDGEVTLTWDAVPGAERYAVAEYKDGGYHNFTLDCQGTSYVASNLSNGVSHTFLVQAYVNGKWSPYTTANHVSATPSGTVKPSVTGTVGDMSAKLTWDPVSGASQYAIAVKTDGGYKTYTYDCQDTEYTISNLTGGVPLSFLVQAKVDGRWSSFDDSDLVTVTPYDSRQPKNVQAVAGDGEVTLTWDAVPGAERYAIAEYKDGGYHNLTLDCEENGYVATNLSNGKEHAFLVQAYVNGTWSSYSEANHVSATPEGLTKPNPTAVAGDRSVTLSWDKVPGTERYAIAYRLDDGSYKTLTYDCTDTSFTVEDLVGNVTYDFVVQSYIDGAWTPFTDADLVEATPTDVTQPQNVRVVSTGDGTVTLQWDEVEGATRYAIAEYYRGYYRTFTTGCTSTTYTAQDVANNMNHHFLVQAYVDGRWSSFDESMFVGAYPEGTYKPIANVAGGYANITVRWGSVPGATSYVVSEYLGNGAYREIARGITGNEYTIWNLEGQSTHGYLVQAYIDAAGSYSSYSSSDVVYAKTTNPAMPQSEVDMINAARWQSSRTGYLIVVDRANCKIGVFTGYSGNWSIQYFWDCCPGKPSTPTISGSYATTGYHMTQLTIDSRAKYCTQVYGGYFIHSVLNSTSELGHQLSHGCIRLDWGNAQWIYNNIPAGTKVYIY